MEQKPVPEVLRDGYSKVQLELLCTQTVPDDIQRSVPI